MFDIARVTKLPRASDDDCYYIDSLAEHMDKCVSDMTTRAPLACVNGLLTLDSDTDKNATEPNGFVNELQLENLCMSTSLPLSDVFNLDICTVEFGEVLGVGNN